MQVVQVSAAGQTQIPTQTVNLALPHGQLNTAAAGNVMEIGKMVVVRCNFCPATFQRRQALAEHIQSVHQPTTAHLAAGGQHQVTYQCSRFIRLTKTSITYLLFMLRIIN